MAILQIIDQLADKISTSPKVPFSSDRRVDAGEIGQILERLRISVPSSIMESERTLEERERILSEAESEAKRIVAQARQRANEILSQDGLVAMARKEADRIVDEGRQQARLRAEEADAYSVEKLQEINNALKRMQAEVENGLQLLRGRTRPTDRPVEQQGERPANAPAARNAESPYAPKAQPPAAPQPQPNPLTRPPAQRGEPKG